MAHRDAFIALYHRAVCSRRLYKGYGLPSKNTTINNYLLRSKNLINLKSIRVNKYGCVTCFLVEGLTLSSNPTFDCAGVEPGTGDGGGGGDGGCDDFPVIRFACFTLVVQFVFN